LGLAKQVRDKLFVGFRKPTECFHIADELFRKSQVFLITPTLTQMTQLTCDCGRLFIEFFIEAPQHLRESAKFSRIDNGLCHSESAFESLVE
jgi:hypothetical protein